MKQKPLFLTICLSALSAFSADYFVDASMPDDTGAATNWATAKQTIQAAVDLTVDGDTVLVTNGVYDTGGAVTPGYLAANRVCITNSITVRSINGPDETIIKGSAGANGGNDVDSVRGVFVANSCSMIGFTITNGYTMGWSDFNSEYGGGVWLSAGCMASNCVIIGNSAYSFGGGVFLESGGVLNNCTLIGNKADRSGGGVFLSGGGILNNCLLRENSGPGYGGGGAYLSQGGVLNNCTLSGNSAYSSGGGAYLYRGGTLNNCMLQGNFAYAGNGGDGGGVKIETDGVLNNCTLSGNSAARYGGGVRLSGGVLNNCIVWANEAPSRKNIYNGGTVRYTCASDGVTNGVSGCITNDPLFVDQVNSNFQLQPNSLCINGGNNAYASAGNDLAGNPRIIGGTVDMGAYEFYAVQDDYDSDGIPNGWAAEHFGGINRADANAFCSNGVNSILQAYIAGLDPNDPDSKFSFSVDRSTPFGNVLRWQSVSGREYAVYYSTNLLTGFIPLIQHLVPGDGTYIDEVYEYDGPRYYKIDVQIDDNPDDNVTPPSPLI